MILKNNDKILKYGNHLLYNPSYIGFALQMNSFPISTSFTARRRFLLEFSEPTQVIIDWGDNTIELYNTRVDSNDSNVFDIDIDGDSSAVITSQKNYTNSDYKLIKIYYNSQLLTRCLLYNLCLGVKQRLLFDFVDNNNLITFNAQNVKFTTNSDTTNDGCITELNLDSLIGSNVENLTFINFFSSTHESHTKIPDELFLLPLKSLGISGNYHQNLLNSNVSRIGTDFDSLERLNIRVPFTQAQGFPIDHSILKDTLKAITITNLSSSFSWNSLPLNIKNFSRLEELNISGNIRSSGFSIASDFFENFYYLKSLNLRLTNRYISDYSWIMSLPDSVEQIDLTDNSNLTNLNTSIMSCFSWIYSNGFENKILMFGSSFSGTTTPSGTYQEPIDHSDPQSPLEAIWVLVNDYNCTVTYKA